MKFDWLGVTLYYLDIVVLGSWCSPP